MKGGLYQVLLDGAFLALLFAVVLVFGVFSMMILVAFIHEKLGIVVDWRDLLVSLEIACAAVLSCILGVIANIRGLPWFQRRSTPIKLLMLLVLLTLLASIVPAPFVI